ncbi:8622_t:CDS:1, partial [Funneliformis caledonium]
MNSFQVIRKESKSDIASSCLIYAIKPERNFKKTDLLEFLINKIDQPSIALKHALDHYKVGFKLNYKTIRTTTKIRSLSVHSNFYYWILKNCDPNSEISRKCFDDIFESRIWIDLKLQETPERNIPKHLTTSSFNSICYIYLEFCNGKVPFNQDCMQYLQLVNNNEIINPIFGISLPIIFGLEIKETLPLKNIYEFNLPEIKFNNSIQNNNNKRNFDKLNNHQFIKRNK